MGAETRGRRNKSPGGAQRAFRPCFLRQRIVRPAGFSFLHFIIIIHAGLLGRLRATPGRAAAHAPQKKEGGTLMETYRFTTCPSPVGRLTLASDGENLVGLWLEGQKYFGQPLLPGACVQDGGLAVFRAARQWLDAYFAGEQPCPGALPLRPAGSAFRQQVWALLCRIPYGATTTYGALAARLAAQMGRPSMSSQAVGGAVGHNPISIIIPCHRVVGSHGSLTGYAGGLAAKARLLAHEGVDMRRLHMPQTGTAL